MVHDGGGIEWRVELPDYKRAMWGKRFLPAAQNGKPSGEGKVYKGNALVAFFEILHETPVSPL